MPTSPTPPTPSKEEASEEGASEESLSTMSPPEVHLPEEDLLQKKLLQQGLFQQDLFEQNLFGRCLSIEGLSEKRCFYINVDTSGKWPSEGRPICKFGITYRDPEARREENEMILKERWGIDTSLEICFLATGAIACEDVEERVRDHTLDWRPDGFARNAEWRRCQPRQLARIAVLVAEKRRFTEGVPAKESPTKESPTQGQPAGGPPAEGARAERGGSGESISGVEVHVEPMPAVGKKTWPLREPRPEKGPRAFFSGEVSTKLRQPHWCLRRRNFQAEERALRASGGEAPTSDSILSVRLSPAQDALLRESVSYSAYRSRSAYLRAVATGRDRSAPLLAKAGSVLFWVRRYLGDKVGGEQWNALGKLLQLLMGTDEGHAEIGGTEVGSREEAREETFGKAIRLLRKHLLARHLLAADGGSVPRAALCPGLSDLSSTPEPVEKDFLEDEAGSLEGLIQPGEQESAAVTATFRLCAERKAIIEENARHSDYQYMSTYIRHVALGWDRDPSVVSQCAAATRWVASCLQKGKTGGRLRQEHWDELEALMQEHFDVFLFGSRGEADVDGTLRRGAEHLLGTSLETISKETGLSSIA